MLILFPFRVSEKGILFFYTLFVYFVKSFKKFKKISSNFLIIVL